MEFDADFLDLDEATKAAQDGFKVKYLFPWQQLVISNILDSEKAISEHPDFSQCDDDEIFCRGRQIVLLPTGAGKSMCFLVPAMLLKGPTLVLYPLLALMADQQRRMELAGIKCVVFKGGQSDSERDENFSQLEAQNPSGKAKVILANPEVLQDKSLLKKLKSCNISHIAIDEAHCVSEWGDSFRPAYLTLGSIISFLDVKIVTAFTATASPPVLNRVGEVLFGGLFHVIRGASDRPNLHYQVRYAYAKQKEALFCAKTMRKPMIIFCGSRKRTEDMARLLAAYFGSDKAKFYHAGMTKEEKLKIEKWFFDSSDGILTATCAYGMGMDKGNIYTVVHLDAPEHLENFAQEAGRAGRKGDDVDSVLIWNHADSVRHKAAKEGSREKAMGDFAMNKKCRRQFLLDYLGGEETVCSGCDICDAQRQNKTIRYSAADAEFVYKFIKTNRRIFSKGEATYELTKLFNEQNLKEFGINIWESKDTSEIMTQLISEKKIKICGGLWKNLLDISSAGEVSFLLKIIPRNLRHRLHQIRLKFRQVLEPGLQNS